MHYVNIYRIILPVLKDYTPDFINVKANITRQKRKNSEPMIGSNITPAWQGVATQHAAYSRCSVGLGEVLQGVEVAECLWGVGAIHCGIAMLLVPLVRLAPAALHKVLQ